MPLGMAVDLGPGHIVLDGDPAPSPMGHSPLIFGSCLLGPNDWMDQDATWCGGRPQSRPHCVRWLPISPKGTASPSFWPMSVVAKRLDESRCQVGIEVDLGQGHTVLDGTQLRSPRKGHNSLPLF